MKPHTANFVPVFSSPDKKVKAPQEKRLTQKTTFIDTTLQKSVTVSLFVNVKYNQTNPKKKSDYQVRVQKPQSRIFPVKRVLPPEAPLTTDFEKVIVTFLTVQLEPKTLVLVHLNVQY